MPLVPGVFAITYSNERTLLNGPLNVGLGACGTARGTTFCVLTAVSKPAANVALLLAEPPGPMQESV